EGGSAGKDDDVLRSLVLEHGCGRVHAAVGLELPELFAVRLVECGEPAVVASDEEQTARGHDRPAVALVRPLLPPDEAVRPDVEGREDAALRSLDALDDAAGVER